MNRKSVILGVFSDRIEVLVCGRDYVIAARRLAVELGGEASGWRRNMQAAAPALRRAIEEVGALGCPCTVFYRNPTAIADYASVELASPSQARQATMLGCAESLTCPLDESAQAALLVGRDSHGEPRQTHLVVAADHDDALAAIASLVAEAGLQFEFATPIEAPLMACLASTALSADEPLQGFLYVGEQRSSFVIADRGKLLFARTISLGSEGLALSLTKPIRAASGAGSGSAVELSLPEARDLLYRFGFPDREQTVDGAHRLTGAQIIPLLQPILQRFVVELRQSLRFGVAEDQRSTVLLRVSGPGSVIPNFASVIAAELGLTFSIDERHAGFDWRQPDSAGSELRDVIDHRQWSSPLALLPKRLSKSRQINRLKRWLLTGAAASLAMTAMDAFHFHTRLRDVRQQVAVLERQSSDVQSLRETGTKLLTAIAEMDRLEAMIAHETDSTTSVRAWLQEFSRVTPDSIRLVSVTLSQEKGKPIGRISGCAFDGPSGPGRTQLEPYVARLKDCPLFEDVRLSNVHAGAVGDATGHQFEIHLTGIKVPRQATFALAGATSPAAASTEGTAP